MGATSFSFLLKSRFCLFLLQPAHPSVFLFHLPITLTFFTPAPQQSLANHPSVTSCLPLTLLLKSHPMLTFALMLSPSLPSFPSFSFTPPSPPPSLLSSLLLQFRRLTQQSIMLWALDAGLPRTLSFIRALRSTDHSLLPSAGRCHLLHYPSHLADDQYQPSPPRLFPPPRPSLLPLRPFL